MESTAQIVVIQWPAAFGVSRPGARARAGGFRIGDGFISPLDLIAIGLVSAEEAQELHSLESQSQLA